MRLKWGCGGGVTKIRKRTQVKNEKVSWGLVRTILQKLESFEEIIGVENQSLTSKAKERSAPRPQKEKEKITQCPLDLQRET